MCAEAEKAAAGNPAILKRIAKEEGLQLIDLDAAVPKSLTYFRDEVHYQDTTYALVADVVADALAGCLIGQHTAK